jgi:PAS domain S-box-containing protein
MTEAGADGDAGVRETLRETEAHIGALLETSVDGIITIDSGGRVLACNPAAGRIFGYEPSEVIGQDVSILMADPHRGQHGDYLANYLRTGVKKVIGVGREVVGRRKDGSEVPLDLAVSEIRLPRRHFFLGVVRDISERKRAEQQRAQLLQQVLLAQEEERRRISRDLHDGVGQSVTSLIVGLHAIREARTAEAARAKAEELARVAAVTLEDVRRLAQGLRPSVLDDLGLAAALERLAAQCSTLHHLPVDLHVPPADAGRLPPAVETALYRITQEALANATRHAGASRASVVIGREPGRVRALIEDDGRGFDPEAPPGDRPGLGLAGMRERAALLGGSVTVESSPGGGTGVFVTIPLPEGMS